MVFGRLWTGAICGFAVGLMLRPFVENQQPRIGFTLALFLDYRLPLSDVIRHGKRMNIPRKDRAVKAVSHSLGSLLQGFDSAVEGQSKMGVNWIGQDGDDKADVWAIRRRNIPVSGELILIDFTFRNSAVRLFDGVAEIVGISGGDGLLGRRLRFVDLGLRARRRGTSRASHAENSADGKEQR